VHSNDEEEELLPLLDDDELLDDELLDDELLDDELLEDELLEDELLDEPQQQLNPIPRLPS
jgi:hypothetical protein